jgi:hypothetical protein
MEEDGNGNGLQNILEDPTLMEEQQLINWTNQTVLG